RGNERKRRGGRIGRDDDGLRLKLGLAFERDAAAALADGIHADFGTEMSEYAFGVIARRLGLDYGRLTGCREPREQHRGLELRGGDGRLVYDGDRVERALQGQREPPAVGGRDHLRAHALERIEHTPHRTAAQRSVAVEARGDRRPGDRTEQQPATGAGISEIERSFRLRKPSDADAVNAPAALAGALDARA